MTRITLVRAVLATVTLPLIAACTDCEGLEGAAARGSIDPPLLDLGPVPLNSDCQAVLQVQNKGTADLFVDGNELTNTSGDWAVQRVPQNVPLGGADDLIVRYTAGGTANQRQSTTVRLQTNSVENDGVLTATITALPTDEAAGVAVALCGDGDARGPCEGLAFGATQIGTVAEPAVGKSLQVDIVNEGNAPLEVSAAIIDGGGGDFEIEARLLGNVATELPVTLAPGRAGACQPLTESSCVDRESCNVLTLVVRYRPTALGGDAATLSVFTDAAEGAQLDVPLTGQGSDIGIVVLPDFVSFADVGEGDSGSVDLRVLNVGSREEAVNDSCIDVGGDGTCDGLCTGGDGEKVLDGALGCDVTRADGSNEGKGFVLAPTDAAEGGLDERIITVTWAPVAGNSEIPGGTVLRLETNLSANGGVITVPITGGSAGILRISADEDLICGEGLCLPAESDTPEDTTTWTGRIDFQLLNEGDGTLAVERLAFDDSQPTIADDFTLLHDDDSEVAPASPGITLAPGANVTLSIVYANNDASQEDIINLLVEHTGLGGQLTIPVAIIPPQ